MARKKEEVEIPSECCGVCKFCVVDKQSEILICIASPPMPIMDDDGSIAPLRGLQVEALDPICWYFNPRLHA